MRSATHCGEACGCAQSVTADVVQTLDEMQFERSIHAAIASNKKKRFEDLLAKATRTGTLHRLVNSVDQSGISALHYACNIRVGSEQDALFFVEKLIANGAHVFVRTKYGATALHRAASANHGSVCAMLLRAARAADDVSALLLALDDEQQSALHKAATAGSGDALQCILGALRRHFGGDGAQLAHFVNRRDRTSQRAADYAQLRHAHLKRLFIEYESS